MNEIVQHDVSREGLSMAKVRQLGRLFVPSLNHAIVKVNVFRNINVAKINELLGTNFRGIILDIDECVAPHHGEILPENVDAIMAMIADGVKLVIFSNMKASDRYNAVIERASREFGYDIKVIMTPHGKPDERGFEASLKELKLAADEQALMIGDNLVTDGGSISAGIPFVKVRPLQTPGESGFKRAKRAFQTSSRSFYGIVSNLYDTVSGRRVLRDEDFE